MKKLLLLLLVFVFGFGLVACTKPENGDGPGDDGEKVQVDFWHMSPVGETSYQGMRALIREYNETNTDNVYVKATGIGFWDYGEKLNISMAGGNAPDIGLSTLDDVPYRAGSNGLINISELIKNDTGDNQIVLENYLENQLKFARYNGDLFAMPFTATARLMFYNLDLFEAAGLTEADVPKTWEELKIVSDKITKVDSNGDLEVVGFHPSSGNNTFASWLWQKDLDFFNDDLQPVLNSPEVEEILEWVGNFNGHIPFEKIQAFGAANQMLGIDPFVAGKFGMMVDVDALYYKMKDAGTPFKFGVAPVPYPEGGKRVNWSSGFSLEMYKNKNNSDAKIKATFAFYKWLLSEEIMLKLADVLGGLTAHYPAMVEHSKDDPILTKIVEELKYAVDKRYVPFAPSWHGADWGPIYNDYLNHNITAKEALIRAEKMFLEKKANWESTQK